jgi:hypothetical protein
MPLNKEPPPYTDLFVRRRDLVAALAKCAIQQSPYGVPPHLTEALMEFSNALVMRNVCGELTDDVEYLETFEQSWYAAGSEQHIAQVIRQAILLSPHVEAWNVPADDDGAPITFTSRISAPVPPEQDFIDIDALIRNASRELWVELSVERQRWDDFDHRNVPWRRQWAAVRRWFTPSTKVTSVSDKTGPGGCQAF